jgi:tRNA-2-methylthio-N6-dimethylallyladenosine synthase
MNELDSELVLGRLGELGYERAGSPDDADVILYNTCSVREHAEQKVWSRLGEIKAVKTDRPGLVVGVLGCMAERDGEDLVRRMPVVDVLCGPGELDKLPDLLENAILGKPHGRIALQGNTSRRSATLAAAGDSLEMLDLARSISPIDHNGSAYVRITRGCNKFCTYCVVPFTRGAEIHRPPDHIVDECKRLADAGVVEVTLLGQTVNHYRFEHGSAVAIGGITQPQKGRTYKGAHNRDTLSVAERVTTFADLLARIHHEVPAIARLRFVTSYPRDFGDDILAVMRDCPRICRYLHVPVQSGSDRILNLMNRGYTVAEYEDFLARARDFLDRPDHPLMIASDFIVGFPTESEEDFRASLALLRRCKFKNNFIFKYSSRPGTHAHDRLPDDVPDEIKRRRNNEMLAAQAEISDAIGASLVGHTFDVFVEGLSKKQRKRASNGTVSLTVSGREADATNERSPGTINAVSDGPVQLAGRTDGDQIVFFDAPSDTMPDQWIGRVVPIRITSADRLSMFGRPV